MSEQKPEGYVEGGLEQFQGSKFQAEGTTANVLRWERLRCVLGTATKPVRLQQSHGSNDGTR